VDETANGTDDNYRIRGRFFAFAAQILHFVQDDKMEGMKSSQFLSLRWSSFAVGLADSAGPSAEGQQGGYDDQDAEGQAPDWGEAEAAGDVGGQ